MAELAGDAYAAAMYGYGGPSPDHGAYGDSAAYGLAAEDAVPERRLPSNSAKTMKQPLLDPRMCECGRIQSNKRRS